MLVQLGSCEARVDVIPTTSSTKSTIFRGQGQVVGGMWPEGLQVVCIYKQGAVAPEYTLAFRHSDKMSPYIVSSVLLAVFGLANAQVPGFGGCPEFVAMSDFDMSKFLGTWYEAERYVNIFEAGTRCVRTNYTKAADGRFLVSNEIMNRYTGVKRVLEGEIRLVVKGAESKLNVKYPNLPIPYDTQYTVLETDYDDYAVIWSCSSLGIVNTQQAWVMTRQRLPSGTTLQKAYGVLDNFKLSRSFFFKTDQESCNLADSIKTESNAAKDSDRNPEVVVPAASNVEPVHVPAPPPPVASPVHEYEQKPKPVSDHHQPSFHSPAPTPYRPAHKEPVHEPTKVYTSFAKH